MGNLQTLFQDTKKKNEISKVQPTTSSSQKVEARKPENPKSELKPQKQVDPKPTEIKHAEESVKMSPIDPSQKSVGGNSQYLAPKMGDPAPLLNTSSAEKSPSQTKIGGNSVYLGLGANTAPVAQDLNQQAQKSPSQTKIGGNSAYLGLPSSTAPATYDLGPTPQGEAAKPIGGESVRLAPLVHQSSGTSTVSGNSAYMAPVATSGTSGESVRLAAPGNDGTSQASTIGGQSVRLAPNEPAEPPKTTVPEGNVSVSNQLVVQSLEVPKEELPTPIPVPQTEQPAPVGDEESSMKPQQPQESLQPAPPVAQPPSAASDSVLLAPKDQKINNDIGGQSVQLAPEEPAKPKKTKKTKKSKTKSKDKKDKKRKSKKSTSSQVSEPESDVKTANEIGKDAPESGVSTANCISDTNLPESGVKTANEIGGDQPEGDVKTAAEIESADQNPKNGAPQ